MTLKSIVSLDDLLKQKTFSASLKRPVDSRTTTTSFVVKNKETATLLPEDEEEEDEA